MKELTFCLPLPSLVDLRNKVSSDKSINKTWHAVLVNISSLMLLRRVRELLDKSDHRAGKYACALALEMKTKGRKRKKKRNKKSIKYIHEKKNESIG
jgi:hypothetical protein